MIVPTLVITALITITTAIPIGTNLALLQPLSQSNTALNTTIPLGVDPWPKLPYLGKLNDQTYMRIEKIWPRITPPDNVGATLEVIDSKWKTYTSTEKNYAEKPFHTLQAIAPMGLVRFDITPGKVPQVTPGDVTDLLEHLAWMMKKYGSATVKGTLVGFKDRNSFADFSVAVFDSGRVIPTKLNTIP